MRRPGEGAGEYTVTLIVTTDGRQFLIPACWTRWNAEGSTFGRREDGSIYEQTMLTLEQVPLETVLVFPWQAQPSLSPTVNRTTGPRRRDSQGALL